jgi:hypothetical protein
MAFPKLSLQQVTPDLATDTELETKVDAKMQETILGTTSYKYYTGSPTAYVANSWVTIFSMTTTKTTRIKALTITNAGTGLTGAAYRICSPPGTTIFSQWRTDTDSTFTSGLEQIMDEIIQIKKGDTFSVEVYCTATTDATATLNSIKVIELS